MKSPKQVCRDHNLYSYQAQKGAEVMAAHITEEILAILNTASVRPLHERVAEYLNIKQDTP